MARPHQSELQAFLSEHRFRGKGELSVALVVTQHAKTTGLPLDSETLLTDGGGQVYGLGKAAVQSVLNRHGIDRVLAAEGGRTSRGSIGKMRLYVSFLNGLKQKGEVDLNSIEEFWIERVHEFFAGKPFKIKLDTSKSLRAVVRDVIEQAQERQKTTPGMQCAGAVLQHMVGAKLDCVLGVGNIEHHSFSTADAPSGRAGDFLIGDVALHVTTSPGEAVISKCADNLNAGLRPVLVTLMKGLSVADGLAANVGLAERIDIFEIEQFVALNLYELGKFAPAGRRVAVTDLVDRYNAIVDEIETDPSLKIQLYP
jgi:hypothetical protein